MWQDVLYGAEAGAVGTLALDVASYVDMVVRGRGASGTPAKVAGALAESVGIDLSGEGKGLTTEKAQNRQSGLGSLMGYGTGVALGLAYGVLRPRLGRVSPLLLGAALGVSAMAASDTPAVATGSTDLRTWGVSGWLADILPHLVYGVVTAAAFESMRG